VNGQDFSVNNQEIKMSVGKWTECSICGNAVQIGHFHACRAIGPLAGSPKQSVVQSATDAGARKILPVQSAQTWIDDALKVIEDEMGQLKALVMYLEGLKQVRDRRLVDAVVSKEANLNRAD
jgi:hypothetical protein